MVVRRNGNEPLERIERDVVRTLSFVLWTCVATATVVVMNMDELIRRFEEKPEEKSFRVHIKADDELNLHWVKKPYPVLAASHY